MNVSYAYIASLAVVFMIDIVVSFSSREKKIESKNPILILNQKNGFAVATLIKAVVFIVFIYAITNPMSGYNLWPIIIIAYLCLVVQMMKDVFGGSKVA